VAGWVSEGKTLGERRGNGVNSHRGGIKTAKSTKGKGTRGLWYDLKGQMWGSGGGKGGERGGEEEKSEANCPFSENRSKGGDSQRLFSIEKTKEKTPVG